MVPTEKKSYKNFPAVGNCCHGKRKQGMGDTSMVKGISRRVVVVDSPDRRFFEQAIFIVRNDAAGEGVSSRERVEEARRVAKSYTASSGRWGRALRNLPPALYTLLGSAGVGLMWFLTTLS